MAKNEVVTAITIKTEQSQQTIKGLRKEIADLKKTLDSAVIGSDEFEKASKELSTAQATLKTVLADGNKTIEAVEGSYNHLVATMAELKKQWKATADEAKRNELGKQIDSINTKLKGLDGTIGNNQRLVGSYAEEFKKALGEADDATLQTRTKLESVQKVTAGLASGYAAVTGAMTLLNIENENLQQAMVKVQSAMAIAQGIGGLKDLVEGLSRAKVAFKGAAMGATVMSAEATTAAAAMNGTAVATRTATVAMSGFKKALISTGIGALVVIIGVVIGKIVEYIEKTQAAKKAQEELNDTTKKTIEIENKRKETINSAVGSIVGKYKVLQEQWKKLSSVQEKNTWINKNKNAFNELGISINDVNTAQKVFVENSDKVIKALKDQAKARALSKLYEEAIANQYKAQQKLNDEEKKAKQKYPEGYIPTGDEEEAAGLNDSDYLTVWAENSLYDQKVNGKPRGEMKPTAAVDYSGAKKLRDVVLKPFANDLAVINKEVVALEQAFTDAELTAKQSAAEVASLGISTTTTTGGGGGGETDAEREAKEKAKKQAEVLEEFRVAQLTDEEKKYYELEKKYQEYLKLFEGDVNKQLQVAEWYNDEYTKLVLAELDERIKADTEIAKSAEETRQRIAEADKQRYEEAVAESEKRLNSKLGNIDKETEKDIYTTERRKSEGKNGVAEIDNELSKIKTLEEIYKKQRDLKVAAIEEEMKGFDTLSERWIELNNEKIGIKEQTTRTLLELEDQYNKQVKEKNKVIAQNTVSTFTSALSSASQIISALQEGIDTNTKEGFEKNKKMQIANATIQMLTGIVNAISSSMALPQPWGAIQAAINAATVATVGGIQIANIKKQQFDGSGGGASTNVSVSPSMGLTDVPISYTRNLMGDTETENLNNGVRVYILESDIEESRRKVDIVESNTDF